MSRSIEDIDFDIDATTYTVRGLMTSINNLNKERDKEVQRILDSIEYTNTCLCSFIKVKRKAKLTINPKCPVHSKLLKL